ncbi:hypothetical protein KAR91_41115 [Candidatus Pacearchaeota archaeon]|nr:hypothetical protein [Candidatus Pacearchaeota archaeon]
MFIEDFPKDIRQQVIIEQQQKEIRALRSELALYKKWCARPKILKEIIHHPVRPRDSVNLLGTVAWDEYIYE